MTKIYPQSLREAVAFMTQHRRVVLRTYYAGQLCGSHWAFIALEQGAIRFRRIPPINVPGVGKPDMALELGPRDGCESALAFYSDGFCYQRGEILIWVLYETAKTQ
jgi:hypothetical protein